MLKYFNELLTDETFEKSIFDIKTNYYLREKEGVEFYATSFSNENNVLSVYLSNGIHARLSIWSNFLDYGRYPDEQTMQNTLNKFRNDIDINSLVPQIDDFEFYSNNYITYLKDLFDSTLSKYKIYVEQNPFFQQYFVFIYEILYNLQCIIVRKNNYEKHYRLAIEAQNKLHQNISMAIIKQKEYIEYVDNAIVLPIQYKHIRKTSDLILSYECYVNSIGKHSVFSDAIYSDKINMSWKEIQYSLSTINSQTCIIDGEIFSKHGDGIIDEVKYIDDVIDEVQAVNDYLFIKQFESGIKYLIVKDLVLKKCELCGRYFFNKFSFNARYCDVPYKNTKSTCQEYVSRNKYKKRASKNPIYVEYNKIYNRVYSRVRRGSMTEEEAKFDYLKELRDNYINKYGDLSDGDEKELLVHEFIEKANALYR